MEHGVRQIPCWLSIIFTLTVIANFVGMGSGGAPALAVYSPLLAPFLLLLIGLYLFAAPYVANGRGMRGAMCE